MSTESVFNGNEFREREWPVKKIPTKIALISSIFEAIVYFFGRDVADVISLNMAYLNIRKIHKERVIKDDSSTGHAQFEMSQMYTNRHDCLLTADRCFSHCIELITGKPHLPCIINLTYKNVNAASRFLEMFSYLHHDFVHLISRRNTC